MKSQMSQVTWDFLKSTFPYLPVIKVWQTLAKVKHYHTKYYLPCWQHWQKAFLLIWRENEVKFSYILWILQSLRMNSKWSMSRRRKSYAIGQWVGWKVNRSQFICLCIYKKYYVKLFIHFLCNNKSEKWKHCFRFFCKF